MQQKTYLQGSNYEHPRLPVVHEAGNGTNMHDPGSSSSPTQDTWTHDDDLLAQKLKERLGLRHLIGESPAFLAVVQKIPEVARYKATVLLTGETGTGKEVCARAIHYLSPRATKPLVPVNCGAIPVDLVENELFGHERGAFTDATVAQSGLIHEADGGTLFLDEVDCLPLLAQVKLLRFLQERQYRPLGSTKTRTVDVRVIAATNVDAEAAVRTGKLRRDLYYRLNTLPLLLPPLRERRKDVLLLARHFLTKYTHEYGKPVTGFSAEAVQKLLLYHWPGNVRELEHIVERAVLLTAHVVISAADIGLPHADEVESFHQAKSKVIIQFERDYVQGLLLAYQGNIAKAARAAQKNRRAFWQLLRKHHIDAQRFKTGAVFPLDNQTSAPGQICPPSEW